MNSREYKQIIEEILFIYADPLKIDDIANVLEISVKEAKSLIDELSLESEFQKRGLLIKKNGKLLPASNKKKSL